MAIKPRPNQPARPDFQAFGNITEELAEFLYQQHLQLVELSNRVETAETAIEDLQTRVTALEP